MASTRRQKAKNRKTVARTPPARSPKITVIRRPGAGTGKPRQGPEWEAAPATLPAPVRITKDQLQRLLAMDKKTRGARVGALVYIGVANVAQCLWCPTQAVLKSRANELEFFSEHLRTRVRHAIRVGEITQPPRSPEAWLEIGERATFQQAERAARAERRASAWQAKLRTESVRAHVERPGGEGPLEMGRRLEQEHGERHFKMRWSFPWRRYVIVGEPDGLTGRYVYEFKSTSQRRYADSRREIGRAQADLYGKLFRRATKRVHLFVREDDGSVVFEEPVDEERADQLLDTFEQLDRGALHLERPEPWKCRICDFERSCPLRVGRDR